MGNDNEPKCPDCSAPSKGRCSDCSPSLDKMIEDAKKQPGYGKGKKN